MTIYQIREFLGWCSVINVGLMLLSFLMMALMREVMYKFHSKLFSITESQFNAILYSFLGVYKVLVFVFNIVPYIAVSVVIGSA